MKYIVFTYPCEAVRLFKAYLIVPMDYYVLSGAGAFQVLFL